MPDINVNKLSEALNTKADIDLNNTGVFSTSSGGVNLVQSTPSDAKGKEVTSADFSLKQGGLELMDIVFAPLGIDESKNKRRYLNGQLIIQEQFPAFTSAVKSRMTTMANAFTTEANWQAEKTNSKLGQCGKFVVDDDAGTIRLPCVVNAQGLVDLTLIGGIKNESLPNIRGTIGTGNVNNANNTGAFGNQTENPDNTVYSTGQYYAVNNFKYNIFDASRVSSAYQDNAPVQQEAVQYPYCIVVNTGVDEAERPINNYQVNNVYSYGMSQYYKGTMNNNSWLKSAGQWNSGTVYTGMYNWLLEQMNAGVSGFVASTGTYTDYDFVINTTDQTFRLPLLNGEEDLPGDSRVDIGTTSPGTNVTVTAPKNGVVFTAVPSSSAGYINVVNTTQSGSLATEGQTGSVHTAAADIYSGVRARKGDKINVYASSQTSAAQIRFTPAIGNGTLYYYVGDTLQNAQLINVARIEETLVTKTDKAQAAEASMPSGKYIDLTLGASNSTYTAPASGWLILNKKATSVGQEIRLTNQSNQLRGYAISATNSSALSAMIPCRKGDAIYIFYSAAGSVEDFSFVYAEGENNV